MPKDDLAQARLARKFRDDLRALKVLYPELTTPAAQARLEEYLHAEIAKEDAMPRSGDRMLGEDLSIVTFRIPKSALPLIDEHLLRMQAVSRWVRLGKSDAQRDIFLRGLEQIELLPAPGRSAVPEPEPELPLERAVTDTVTDTAVTDTVTDTPVTDTVTDTPAAAAATAETVKTARPKTTAKRKTASTTKGRT